MAQAPEASLTQVNELIELLQAFRRVVQSLANQEGLKTEAIRTRDLAALEEITHQQEELSLAMQELESKRQGIALAMGGSAEATIGQLAEIVGGAAGARLR